MINPLGFSKQQFCLLAGWVPFFLLKKNQNKIKWGFKDWCNDADKCCRPFEDAGKQMEMKPYLLLNIYLHKIFETYI